MTLSQWIGIQVAEKRAANKTAALRALVETIKGSGRYVSFITLSGVERGQRLKNYDKAEAIQLATAGAVTVSELCSEVHNG